MTARELQSRIWEAHAAGGGVVEIPSGEIDMRECAGGPVVLLPTDVSLRGVDRDAQPHRFQGEPL